MTQFYDVQIKTRGGYHPKLGDKRFSPGETVRLSETDARQIRVYLEVDPFAGEEEAKAKIEFEKMRRKHPWIEDAEKAAEPEAETEEPARFGDVTEEAEVVHLADKSVDELRAIARGEGIKFDKRWGAKRLAEAIVKASAASA